MTSDETPGSSRRVPARSPAPSVFALQFAATTEEATGPPKLAARAVAALLVVTASSMVAQGFGRFTYPVLLDAINEDVLDSYARAGLLGNAGLAAYLFGTALVTWASTRFDASTLMKLGLALSLGGLALLTTAPGFAMLAVGLFVAGLGGAAVWIPAPGIGASLVGPERGGLAFGLVGSGIGMGIVVAGPLTNLVRSTTNDDNAWRPVFGIQTIVAACVLVALLALLRSGPKPTEQTAQVSVGAIRSVPGWKLLIAAFSVFGVAYSLYFYFFVAQLREEGWSPSASSWIFALVGLASVSGGLIFGRLSDIYPRPNVMAVGFVLMAIAPILTLIGSTVSVIAAAIAFGLCVSGTPTTIGAMLADHLSGRALGAAFGSLTLAFGIAQLAGPPFAGVIGEATGSFRLPFLVASGMAGSGVFVSLRLARSTRLAATEPSTAPV
ncbi:MAG: MFS transporter [Actinomycetota bacterium]|nr:MFS transporter [Actinomycetota bacterium]